MGITWLDCVNENMSHPSRSNGKRQQLDLLSGPPRHTLRHNRNLDVRDNFKSNYMHQQRDPSSYSSVEDITLYLDTLQTMLGDGQLTKPECESAPTR